MNSADAENVKRRNAQKRKLKQHRYFQHFSLSSEDFDYRGNMSYDDFVYEDVRGRWPYYLPLYCKRYGLRVSGRYGNKSDDWLKMDQNPEEWAVGFHGVWAPSNKCEGGKKVL